MLAQTLSPYSTVPGGTGSVVQSFALDLDKGAIGDLCAQTVGLAWKLLLFSAVLALLIEAFGRSPVERRDYLGVAWRVILVALLLRFYAPIFSTVIITTRAIASEFKPTEANQQFADETTTYFQSLDDASSKAGGPTLDPAPSGTATAPALQPPRSFIGNVFYAGAIHMFVTVAQGVFWALILISRIAMLLFYMIGPLALVASVPSVSSVGSRWFGHYVGVATWPIFSALLIRILLAIGISGFYSQNALGHVCVALAMMLSGLAVPTLASALIGGSTTTLMQQGLSTAAGAASQVRRMASSPPQRRPAPAPQQAQGKTP